MSFETKTAADVEGTMSYFSPALATYIDATLGWELASYEALKERSRRLEQRSVRDRFGQWLSSARPRQAAPRAGRRALPTREQTDVDLPSAEIQTGVQH